MAKESKSMETVAGSDLLITRIFDAPVKLVWQAWTDPKQMMKWWGPKKYTSPACKIDFREGGKYLYCMRSPEGQEFWNTGIYKEIVPLKKIVWTDSFADANGNVVSGDVYGMPGLPKEFLVTLTFTEENGKTRFTLLHEGIPAGEMSDMTLAGWNESFDKLAASLR